MQESTKIIKIDGQEYCLRRLNALTQFNFLKPFSSILGKVIGSSGSDSSKAVEAIADAIASLPDETTDKIFLKVLQNVSVVEDHGRGFSPMAVRSTIQYNNVDIELLLKLFVEFFRFNFEDFINKAMLYIKQLQSQK